MKLFDCTQVEELLQRYSDKNGEILEIEEGTLGYGLTVLIGEGLKTIIITERYISEWASGHTIRAYNKTPKKYQTLIDQLN